MTRGGTSCSARLRVLAAALASAAWLSGCGEEPHPPAPLSFSPGTLPDGNVGQAYAVTITVSGGITPVGDISVSAGTLPAGLTLVYAHSVDDFAILSGTPVAAGTWDFTLRAWCFGRNEPGQVGAIDYRLTIR